jgi:hypothetical protein
MGEEEDQKVRAAAIEVAEFSERLDKITADISLLKWMVGFNLAISVAVLGRLLFIHS